MRSKNQRFLKRVLAVLLSFIMVISMVRRNVYAASTTNPEDFTICVKDKDGLPISDATVTYEIFNESISLVTGNAITDKDGYFVLSEMASYETEISNGTVALNYTISKEGYSTQEASDVVVTDVKGNIDVTLLEEGALEATVSVKKTGSGIVKINGSESTEVKVVPNEQITIEVQAVDYNEGISHIKTLTIGKDTIQVDKNKTYSNDALVITEDTDIFVEFVTEYTVTANAEEGGSITINGNSNISVTLDENSEITVAVTPDENYQISSVSINGSGEPVTDLYSFSKNVTITGNTEIHAVFVRVYKVQVSYDDTKGIVVTEPVSAGGKVVVSKGNQIEITATPNTNYRVSTVKRNGNVIAEFNENNKTYETTIDSVEEDYTYVVEFVPNKYTITLNKSENGSVTIDKDSVGYGGSINVKITPNEGYVLDKLTVNGDSIGIERLSDDDVGFTLNNITEDKNIVVTFKTMSVVSLTYVSFNHNDAVRIDEKNNTYVYPKDTTVTFKTTKSGIRINHSGHGSDRSRRSEKEYQVKQTTHINKIEIFYHGEYSWFADWHEVELPSGGIKIIIDKTAPTLNLTIDSENQHGFHNKDVNVKINATDPGDYSGIAKVEYSVKADGEVTQSQVIPVDNKQEYNGEFVVDSILNNSDNVELEVKVTDAAGNVKTEKSYLKINVTKPTVSINIDGTKKEKAAEGYYNTKRTATIRIVDRESTFSEENALTGLTITAKDSIGNDIHINKTISWNRIDQDIHEATIEFDKDANYEWSFNYTNKANLTNEGITETGNNLYKFTVDTTAPTGVIQVEKDAKAWDKLLSVLTFGFFKNGEVVVTATGNDATSPILDISYYMSDATEVLQRDQLDKIYENNLFVKEKYGVTDEEQFVIYARIEDYAGNISYISTEGIIVDLTKSNIGIFVSNRKEIYNDDVRVGVVVTDSLYEGIAYSGIKTIVYSVSIGPEGEEVTTQSGTLYSFNIPDPTKNQLCKYWDSDDTKSYITIDKVLNNDDIVTLSVTVMDNAGNIYERSEKFNINIDKPKVEISVEDSKDTLYNGNGFFRGKREATITIEDRVSAFDSKAATDGIKIKALDSKGNPVELNRDAMISPWESNGDKHTATITFDQDANYEWDFEYTNKAGNFMEEPVVDGEEPFKFTVDSTPPTGEIIISENNTWKTLLSVLTFGLFTNDEFKVSATAEDATSSCVIEYHKTDNLIAMTKSELDEKEFSEFKEFTCDTDEIFVVYLKITDSAGNYTYISSDGAIVDKKPSDISLEIETPYITKGDNKIFNQNVKVKVKVTEEKDSSGIKTVDYLVVKDGNKANPTQEDNLFTFNNSSPKYEELENKVEGTIEVDAALNNSSNVVVCVKAVDNAGNESIEELKLDIDVTQPSINITYDNNKDNNGNGYFNAKRTATVVIKERTNHFDGEKAKNGIEITAVDAKGNPVAIDREKMIICWTTVEGATPDDATHTATINFDTDANYKLDISYTDEAGNENTDVNTGSSVSPTEFTVDRVAPTGTITATSAEGRVTTWNELVRSLTFGFWSNKGITITSTYNDVTSTIESVSYYKTNATKALTETQLKSITDWKAFSSFTVAPNEQFATYLRIVDKAGNTTYISTDGMITDNKQPSKEVFAPTITTNPQQQASDIYNGDVDVTIEVDDPITGGTYSGLKTISYRVLNMGKETQKGTLYSLQKNSPTHDELLKHWSGKITVDSRLNNSNDVVIEVYAQDNALNSSTDKISIKIDTTKPTVHISYNNNNPDSNKYYKEARVATIVVSERNFDPKGVKIDIINTDGSVPTISNWTKVQGTGNLDNTTHTATITYEADGDYNFEIECTDLASNRTTEETFEAGTVNEKAFTIDKTLPQISVSYDNNNAQNGKYFKEHRVATVTVKEHNFDVSRVQFTQTASIEGGEATVPAVSWSSNGDVHTATISYQVDGDYTFDVKMMDMAGNESGEADYGSSVAAKEFTIDTNIIEPEITGVENGVAYKGDVIPSINFSDINYSNYELRLVRTRRDEINVDVTEKFFKGLNESNQGGTGSFNVFDKVQDNDGIYTLYAKVTDKAGNEKEKNVTFTLNRFGSVYAYDNYLVSLIKDGGAYIQHLSDNLVITEYNPDRLIAGSLTVEVTHDGRPLDNVKYEVSPEINDKVAVGSSGWFQYQYVIDKENFAKDGVYKISISSKDATGNTPENTIYEGNNILFRVDTTPPELTSVVGLEESVINAQEVPVKYTVYDTIGLKSVTVYVNGKQHGEVITDFTDINNYAGTFAIGEDNNQQKVRLVIEDLAGNVTDTDSEDFSSAYSFEKSVLVTTNIFVRWYADKLLFWGTIGSVPVVSAGIWAGVAFRGKINIRFRRRPKGM